MTLKAGYHLSDRLSFIADLIHSSEQWKPEEIGCRKQVQCKFILQHFLK